MGTSKIKETADKMKIVIASLITLFFCISMTVPSESLKGFDKILNLLLLICIIYGVIATIIEYRKINVIVLLITMFFFIIRIISYNQNHLTVTYGGAFMLQLFFLVGINKHLLAGKKVILAVFGSFLIFDVLAIAFCYFRFYFKYEEVAIIVEKYAAKGMEPQTSLFQNPNYAGIMAGTAIVICCTLIMNGSIKRKMSYGLILVMLLNFIFLFANTGCRSAQTGVLVTLLGLLLVRFNKKLDSVKVLLGIGLISCFLLLLPLYSLVNWEENSLYLDNVSQTEKTIDALSSGRYAIWKTTILSMKGHELFGFGNSTTAWDKRKELVENTNTDFKSKEYIESANHKRQHNGYLAVYNEAGLVGVISLLLLLLSRIKNLKGRFCDGQWEKMLLIYIFWINLFEAKFILHLFFTGLLMMILFLPPEEAVPE